MAQTNSVHLVPERYRKTRFTASCWFYLSQNPQLTFSEYQRQAKDKVCRESIFDDVKKGMEMDRIFGNKDAVRFPEATEAPPRPHPAPLPPPPNLALKEALTAGLAASGKQSTRGPLTIERRTAAETWIKEHLDEGFAQFKGAYSDPELDKAWFDKIRKKALEPASLPEETKTMPTIAAKKRGKVPGPDTERVRAYLRTLSREKLETMTHGKYMEANRHKGMNGPVFYNEKRKILDALLGKVKAPKAEKPKKEKTSKEIAPKPGTMFITLGELPCHEFKCAPKDLREIALAVVKLIHPRGHEAKVVILSEPHVMEIRVPYR